MDREIKLVLTWNVHPNMISFPVLQGSMYFTQKEISTTVLLSLNPVSYSFV